MCVFVFSRMGMSPVTGTHALSSARIRCILRTVALCVTRVCMKGSVMKTCSCSTLPRTHADAVCVVSALLRAVLLSVLRFGAGTPSPCRDSAACSVEVSVYVLVFECQYYQMEFYWSVLLFHSSGGLMEFSVVF